MKARTATRQATGGRLGLKSGPGALIALIVALLWGVGQIVRDRNSLTALLFYLPSPAIAVFAGFGGWRSLAARRFALGLGNLLLAGLALSMTLNENRRLLVTPPANPDSRPPELVMVHWNVCRGCSGWAAVVAELRRQAADLLVISEVPKKIDVRQLARELSEGGENGYQGRRMGTLAVLARGERLSVQPLVNEYTLEVHRILWTPPNRVLRQALASTPLSQRASTPPFGAAQGNLSQRLDSTSPLSEVEAPGLSGVEALKILAVDIVSSPRVARDPQLRRLVEWIGRERPDLVVGDFNAPRNSLALTHLPAGYRHAYEAAGSGWSATWPSFLPLWQIDHTLLGPAIEPARYGFFLSRASDHRGQRLEFSRAFAAARAAVE
jgi:endonuclease/exonuclease/phosphatase (EEP) superfamily protein YafD